jgi:hypothetical protein
MAPDRPPDPVAVAITAAEIFERLGIPYFAGGSLASSIHGEPRSTLDVDFVADLRAEHVPALITAFGTDFYVSDTAIREALARGTSFNAIHLPTAVKVDVFLSGDDPFNQERLARRERARLWADPPREVYVDRAEHIVLRKLEWYRRGGEVSDRQWRDVLGVLHVQRGRLDEGRLDAWAERLHVADLLERARREAGA